MAHQVSFQQSLRAFIDSYDDAKQHPMPVRADLYFEHFHAYCRIGRRYIARPGGNMALVCFQLANVNTTEAFRGQGTFKRFLAAVREQTSLPFYAELVHNERLACSLMRDGFVEVRRDMGGAPDLLRMT